MDQRQTFDDTYALLSIISAIFERNERVSLLIDNDGLERAEGIITGILPKEEADETCITVDDVITINLKHIIGVNGIFRSDYSEC